jgi:hypothetical protein
MLFAVTSTAEGVLNNRCFYVTEDGALKRATYSLGCPDTSTFNQKSAEGYNFPSSYKIEIVNSKTQGNFDVFEANYARDAMDLDMYSRVTVTSVNNGKVSNQTICDRDLEKPPIPFVKKDTLTCVTTNKKFCDLFLQRVKTVEGSDVTLNDLTKCTTLVSAQMEAMLGAISDSWKDKNYHDLAKKRFDESRKYTDQFASKKIANLTSYSYNLSDSDPASGTLRISGVRQGYDYMKTMFDSCAGHFADSSSADSSKSSHSVR